MNNIMSKHVDPDVTKIYTGKDREKNKDALSQAFGEYLSVLDINKAEKILTGIYWARDETQKITLYKEVEPLIYKLRPLYKTIIAARNDLAIKNGYSNFVEWQKARYGIPESSYLNFLNKSRDNINYLNKKLGEITSYSSSIFDSRCFVCQVSNLKYEIPKEVFDFMVKNFPELSNILPTIDIGYTDENSRMRYDRESKTFSIKLHEKSSSVHKAVDLIHELCHVLTYLSYFKNGKDPIKISRFEREKACLFLSNKVLKSFSLNLWRANCGATLGNYWKTFFEIDSYLNPDQDLDKLYAHNFNRCFLTGKQDSNPFYLLNRFIVALPLTGLVGAVADYETGRWVG